jgi:uncharacterized membrane protein YesL
MLGRALKMAFWITYDHLGKLLVANLIAVLAVFVPALLGAAFFASDIPWVPFAGVPLLLWALVVALPATTAGFAHLTKQVIDTRDAALGDVFEGIRLYGKRAVALGALGWFALCCLATSTWFYANLLSGSASWLGICLSAAALWCLLFVFLMGLIAIPALVQKKADTAETVKLSALLVLDNPLFMFGLSIQFLALTAVCIIVTPLMFFLWQAVSVALLTAAYEQLARKYALIEAAKAGVPAAGAVLAGGIRVISRDGRLVVDDDQDDYLNRGLRDFMFPWKG